MKFYSHIDTTFILMETFQLTDFKVVLDKKGARHFVKVSYPLRCGRWNEIITPEYFYQFNLNGEIKFITGRGRDWPDPSEWLKRTAAGDWVYYSSGGYSGVFDLLGEHYLPCLSYPSNAINSRNPFDETSVKLALGSWQKFHPRLTGLKSEGLPGKLKNFLDRVIQASPQRLELRSQKLHQIIGGRVTVLPPDTRHVDYEVIPITVAEGCLYRCGFCRVKSGRGFSARAPENIKQQIRELKSFYHRDLRNYNAVFLGQHDALNAGADLLEFTARLAFQAFDLGRSNLKGAYLFMFGSVDSVLSAGATLFERLAALPFSTYINIGLESADPATLNRLGKAVSPEKVAAAFSRILAVNRRYENIEMTANFLVDEALSDAHFSSFFQLLENRLDRYYSKGAIYFSPLINGGQPPHPDLKRRFYALKSRSRLPAFLYLIQRL